MAAAPSLNGIGNDQFLGGAALGTRWSFISISVAPAAGGGRSPAQDLAHAPFYLITGKNYLWGGGARLEPNFLSYLICKMGASWRLSSSSQARIKYS